MKYMMIIDSADELSEETIKEIKNTLYLGDEKASYCFEIKSITKMSEIPTGSKNEVGWSSLENVRNKVEKE